MPMPLHARCSMPPEWHPKSRQGASNAACCCFKGPNCAAVACWPACPHDAQGDQPSPNTSRSLAKPRRPVAAACPWAPLALCRPRFGEPLPLFLPGLLRTCDSPPLPQRISQSGWSKGLGCTAAPLPGRAATRLLSSPAQLHEEQELSATDPVPSHGRRAARADSAQAEGLGSRFPGSGQELH